MLSGFNLSGGSASPAGLVLVDEDTGLFHSRGKANPNRNGHLPNQGRETEESSNLVEENITLDKKADSSPFPGNPPHSITDLDVERGAEKPALGTSDLPGILTDGVMSEGLLVLPESHLLGSGPSGEALPRSWGSVISHHGAEHVTAPADKEDSHWWTTESRDGHLVQGSNGRMYRLLRGPPGLMGPPGEDVSPSFIFSLLSPILLLYLFYLFLFDFLLWLTLKILIEYM